MFLCTATPGGNDILSCVYVESAAQFNNFCHCPEMERRKNVLKLPSSPSESKGPHLSPVSFLQAVSLLSFQQQEGGCVCVVRSQNGMIWTCGVRTQWAVTSGELRALPCCVSLALGNRAASPGWGLVCAVVTRVWFPFLPDQPRDCCFPITLFGGVGVVFCCCLVPGWS